MACVERRRTPSSVTMIQPDDELPYTAEAVGTRLDMTIPPECVAGIEANLRLLADHLATLGEKAR